MWTGEVQILAERGQLNVDCCGIFWGWIGDE